MKFLNACLLIIGTAIGAGMLGMPVESSLGGYLPSLLFLFISWLASFVSAIFFVEALAVIKESVNFSTLSEKILGKSSKIFILLIYLVLFLSLIFAYTKGGGIFISDLFPIISIPMGTLLFLLVFFPFLLKGAKTVGRVNFLLTFPMFLSLFLIFMLGIPDINQVNLVPKNWKNGFFSLPIFITAFSFHGIIPTLFNYLNHNKKLTRRAIVVGSLFILVIYVFWQTFIMGIVPFEGEISLYSAWTQDQTAITPLKQLIKSSLLSYLAELFYFCALTTSFLGVSLGLIDFFVDALQIQNIRINKFLIMLLLFVPAFILSSTNLRIFYILLKYGAGIACTLLLVFFPTLLVVKLLNKNRMTYSNSLIFKLGVGVTVAYSILVFYFQLSSF